MRNNNRYDVYENGNRIAIFITDQNIMDEFKANTLLEAIEVALTSGFTVKKTTETYFL